MFFKCCACGAICSGYTLFQTCPHCGRRSYLQHFIGGVLSPQTPQRGADTVAANAPAPPLALRPGGLKSGALPMRPAPHSQTKTTS
jgi:predicted  nucleic acid-binding Zn-ribbon protein